MTRDDVDLRWVPVMTTDGLVHLTASEWLKKGNGQTFLFCDLDPDFITKGTVTYMRTTMPLTCLRCIARCP